jgi:hypothetical protein
MPSVSTSVRPHCTQGSFKYHVVLHIPRPLPYWSGCLACQVCGICFYTFFAGCLVLHVRLLSRLPFYVFVSCLKQPGWVKLRCTRTAQGALWRLVSDLYADGHRREHGMYVFFILPCHSRIGCNGRAAQFPSQGVLVQRILLLGEGYELHHARSALCRFHCW